MAVIYCNPEVAGAGTGTFADPFKSLTSRTFVAGNEYLLAEGCVYSETIGPLGTGGTAESRIIIGVYDRATGARVTRKGAATVNATGLTYGLNITEARPYITVSGLEVFGATAAGLFKGSVSSDPANVQSTWLENCIFRDNRGAGIDMRGQGHKLINCDVLDNDMDGAFIRGNNFELGWCRVVNNGRVGDTGDCVQFVDSSNFYVHDSVLDHSISNSKQALISNLEFHPGTTGGRVVDTWMACPQHVAGVTLADQKTLLIMTPGVTVSRCTIEGGQYGAFMQGADGVLESCLLVVTGAGSVEGVGIRASGVAVRRNTVIGRSDQGGAYGIDHSSSTYTGVTIQENAIKGWARGIRTTTSGYTYSHNAFENCAIRNSNSAGNEGTAGTGDVVGNLKLTADYRPIGESYPGAGDGSPLIAVGPHSGYSLDANGAARWNPPTIGAYEYVRPRTGRT